nr:uncharacterized protein LOC128691039 [Cherax quadricarinatus]
MAKRAFQSIIRRKRKGQSDLGIIAGLSDTKEEEDVVVLRNRKSQQSDGSCHNDDNKRFTINLGVEDLPTVPRPESIAKFHTDDEVGIAARKSSLRLCSTSGDDQDFSPFLLREYLIKEEAWRLNLQGDTETRLMDKEKRLRERRKSLIVVQEELPERRIPQQTRSAFYVPLPQKSDASKENLQPMEDVTTGDGLVFENSTVDGNVLIKGSSTSTPDLLIKRRDIKLSLATQVMVVSGDDVPSPTERPPVPPPRRKRDARKRAALYQSSERSSCSTPDTPGSLVISSGNTQNLATSTPVTHHSFDTRASDTSRGSSGTPEGPLTPSTPITPDSASSIQSFILPTCSLTPVSERSKALTLDNRSKRKSREVEGGSQVYKQRSTEDLLQARYRNELRRSFSDHGELTLKDVMHMKARRTSSDAHVKGDKETSSFRDKLFGGSMKEKGSMSLPSRTFQRIKSVRKTSSRRRKESGYKSDGDQGVVAGVQHAGRGSAPSSPQLAASRSAESTPSKFNIFSKLKGKTGSNVKLTGKNTSKTDKATKNGDGAPESNDGSFSLGRSHSHENIQSPSNPPEHDTHCSPHYDRTRSQQNQDETRRTENTLKIWIMEAKGIPNKKKYYCILKLNLKPLDFTFLNRTKPLPYN